MKKYLTEFVGTFLLVFTIAGVVASNGMAIGIGVALMALVYMGGSVSGAHYNPAVTFALMLLKKMPGKDVVPYWLAQFLGGLCAAAAGSYLYGSTFAPGPASSVSPARAMGIELIFTMMLVLIVLNVAATKRTANNHYFGFAIGAVVVAGALAGGSFSGGAFNPAVGLGPTVINATVGTGTYDHLWIYFAGPLLGALLAAGIFAVQESSSEEKAQ